MRLNRLLCIAFIVGTGIFASYYGGNISYALFYLALLIPVICFIYSLYVFIRFKIYQSVGSYLVVKGDWTQYSFVIANEDFITFRNVKVNFLRDKSTIEAVEQMTDYSLLPSESERMDTRIRCNYRGEYYIGVDSIVVTDFLYLFQITYPIGSKLKVVVLPRIVQLEQIGIAPPQIDVKNPQSFSNSVEEELDTELRKYYPGDSRKRVHWKATARMNELVSRKYQHIPKAEIILFMDLMKIQEEELNIVIAEDKIIESVLAIANFYSKRSLPSRIIYELDGKQQISINSVDDFNAFYKACVKIDFHAKVPVNELMRERMLCGEEGKFYFVATHLLTKELYLEAMQAVARGNYVCILFISDDTSESTKNLMSGMRLSGVNIYQIMSEEEIETILSQGVA